MALQLLDDELEMPLPSWAVAPKGKGVADHLKSKLLDELRNHDLEMSWWRKARSKTWTSLVNGLIRHEPQLAERVVRDVVASHRKRYSKQYSLD